MCNSSIVEHRNCILPPHVLDAIEIRGEEHHKEMVYDMRGHAEVYRQARWAAQVEKQPKAPVAMMAAAPKPMKPMKPNRSVYDGHHKARLPGTLVRSEGDKSVVDKSVNRAYNGAGKTFNFYKKLFDRNSLDGHGLKLKSTVHHRKNYNNAFWNGSQMAYGDGDGRILKDLTLSLTVIGHELSHGVVQYSGGLVYQGQSGALNESFADVFGSLVVQYARKKSAHEASWLIGSEILAPGINGKGLRSLKAPGTAYDDPLIGKDPQPYHMSHYVHTYEDDGGVHINSGIPNHAFYLLATFLGGNAWEAPGRIWYEALHQNNNPHLTFTDWADLTVHVARDMFGRDSDEAVYTRRAWKLVGISV